MFDFFQDIAQNYVAGMILIISDHFTKGDVVTIGDGIKGTVQKVTLRHVELTTVNPEKSNELLYTHIPSSKVFENVITVHKKA